MLNFLHTFEPSPVLFELGKLKIYWYGFFIVVGILLATFIAIRLAKYYDISKNDVIDLGFWLIINGVIGARFYHIFLELGYYLENPLSIFKIWQGGLAIHGAIIAGVLTIYLFGKKRGLSFWTLSSLVVPGLAIGQAMGRWGNYFNQELFGLPTEASWGIPIKIINRPLEFIYQPYFHPTFLYESAINVLIFTILITLHALYIRKGKLNFFNNKFIVLTYLVLYSITRFMLEFVRIDRTPEIFSLRWPQIASSAIILIVLIIIAHDLKLKKQLDNHTQA